MASWGGGVILIICLFIYFSFIYLLGVWKLAVIEIVVSASSYCDGGAYNDNDLTKHASTLTIHINEEDCKMKIVVVVKMMELLNVDSVRSYCSQEVNICRRRNKTTTDMYLL